MDNLIQDVIRFKIDIGDFSTICSFNDGDKIAEKFGCIFKGWYLDKTFRVEIVSENMLSRIWVEGTEIKLYPKLHNPILGINYYDGSGKYIIDEINQTEIKNDTLIFSVFHKDIPASEVLLTGLEKYEFKSIIFSDLIDSISIDPGFINWPNLETIVFPDTLDKLDYSMFFGCNNIKRIKIPNIVTETSILHGSRWNLPEGALLGLFNLEEVEFDNFGLNWPQSQSKPTAQFKDYFKGPDEAGIIRGYTYDNSYGSLRDFERMNKYVCNQTIDEFTHRKGYYYFPKKLKTIKINRGVIGQRMFEGCSTIETIVIGKDVQYIDENAFLGTTAQIIYDKSRLHNLKTKTCPFCNQLVSSKANYCEHCGKELLNVAQNNMINDLSKRKISKKLNNMIDELPIILYNKFNSPTVDNLSVTIEIDSNKYYKINFIRESDTNGSKFEDLLLIKFNYCQLFEEESFPRIKEIFSRKISINASYMTQVLLEAAVFIGSVDTIREIYIL